MANISHYAASNDVDCSYSELKLSLLWGTDFSKRGPILAAKISLTGSILAAKMVREISFSAKIGPAGPILGGTDFGVTVQTALFTAAIL